jgi:hypothetical protein
MSATSTSFSTSMQPSGPLTRLGSVRSASNTRDLSFAFPTSATSSQSSQTIESAAPSSFSSSFQLEQPSKKNISKAKSAELLPSFGQSNFLISSKRQLSPPSDGESKSFIL